MVREMDGKPSTDVNTGRVKVLELLSWYLARLGRAAAEPYAKDIQTACVRTFRTELGTQKSVKAAALLPLTALFKIGLPVLTHQVRGEGGGKGGGSSTVHSRSCLSHSRSSQATLNR